MWSFDLETEDYSPVSINSIIAPSPRSEVAHARSVNNIILFGGKSDTELLNDMYVFNLVFHTWEMVQIDSLEKPTPRRASCLAVTENSILIFGGITSEGYSNELWEFDWSTREYKLMNARGSPPVSAFSKCEVYKSGNQTIFRAYMAETEGENRITYIYDYNLHTQKWSAIRSGDISDLLPTKSEVYLLNDKIISIGGSLHTIFSYTEIYLIDINTGEVSTNASLPRETFYAASVFYKDKIYIYGGAESYGWLPLRENLRDDLIIVELNHDCQEEPNQCIATCSKGTYYSQGECNLCSAGSYSDTIGSNSCKLCSKGYSSATIGADTLETCTPCPKGYFNLYEGQPRCLDCPAGSECSLYSLDEYSEEVSQPLISEQPVPLVYGDDMLDSSFIYLDISLGICYSALILLLIASYRTRRFLKNLDIYSNYHNYSNQKTMLIRRTIIGGIFSIAFALTSISVVSKLSTFYALENVIEGKALVPLIALEENYKSVIFI
jgi:hypothetical protein